MDNFYLYQVRDEGPANWQNVNPRLVGTRIPAYYKPDLDPTDQVTLSNCVSAVDFYNLFQPKSWTNQVVYQSRLYACSKGQDHKVIILFTILVNEKM